MQFAHLTKTRGGATMDVHTNQIAEPGDNSYFVGGEPDKHGNRIPTVHHGATEIDASGGYTHLPTAVGHMKDRNEKALWSMKTMDPIRNPDHVDNGSSNASAREGTTSDLSPSDVLRHKARLMDVGGKNPAMSLGSWRDTEA